MDAVKRNIKLGLLIFVMVYIVGGDDIDCPYFTFEETSTSGNTEFRFSYDDPHPEKGYAVELFFSNGISNLQVNRSDNTPANVSDVSETHWIVSTYKIPPISKNQTSFTGVFINSHDSKLTGVILNGVNILCGEGNSKIFVPQTMKYDGHRICTPKITTYEHSSDFALEESFYSHALGLVMDVIFDTNIDKIEKVDVAVFKRVNKRRFTFINLGYVTEVDKPINLNFEAHHQNKPPPKILAIYINNVIICGFAPVTKVTNFDALKPISSMLEEAELKSQWIETLLWPLAVISASGIVTAIVTGVLAWKLTSQYPGKENNPCPLYATPRR